MTLYAFNFSEEEETEIVRKQFEEAYFTFMRKAIANGDPVMCELTMHLAPTIQTIITASVAISRTSLG